MIWIISVGFILKILMVQVYSRNLADTKLHTYTLDHKTIKLSWLIDWSKREVMFNVDNSFSPAHRWFSFGFSKRGQLPLSDLCFFHRPVDQTANQTEHSEAIDAHVTNDLLVYRDIEQNCKILRITDTSVAFRRSFDTCDPQDLRMHDGTMYILWARGVDELMLPRNLSMEIEPMRRRKRDANMGTDNGLVMIQILRSDKLIIPERNLTEIVVRLNEVKVPVKETVYWCHVMKIDDFIKRNHHIVQFEPIIVSPAIIHHMEVFHCDAAANVEIPEYNGDCDDLPTEAKVCSKVISLWAMGASTFTYPIETGLPIGGSDYNPYIRLEVHFNNPDLLSGIVDSSGMRIKLVDKLRKYDAAIMELGLEYTDKMAIPPGVLAFPLSGYCISECTSQALPETGIQIFASQLHTHLRGVRVLTRHFRDGLELREVNRDDYYSHHFQEIRPLRYQPKILPGDSLVTTCYYDTQSYKEAVLGGFSISDEMCVNYIHYYPATKLEVCKSSVSEGTLNEFFTYIQKKEMQKSIDLLGPRSQNYKGIDWTESVIDELFAAYVLEPLSMQCNQSNGNRFPGYEWEGAPITSVELLVPVHQHHCNNYNPYGLIPLEQGNCGFMGECIY